MKHLYVKALILSSSKHFHSKGPVSVIYYFHKLQPFWLNFFLGCSLSKSDYFGKVWAWIKQKENLTKKTFFPTISPKSCSFLWNRYNGQIFSDKILIFGRRQSVKQKGTFQHASENRFRFPQIMCTQRLISTYRQLFCNKNLAVLGFFHKYPEAIGIIAPIFSNEETETWDQWLDLVSYVFP